MHAVGDVSFLCIHSLRATHVENEDGSTVILSKDNMTQRRAIARRLLTPSSAAGAWRGTKKACVVGSGLGSMVCAHVAASLHFSIL